MVKSELLHKMCNLYPNLRRSDVEKILETIFNEILQSLSREENIQIRRFGSFRIVKRKARIGRNPRTNEQIPIAAKNAIRYKISKTFFKRLNKNFTESKISDIH